MRFLILITLFIYPMLTNAQQSDTHFSHSLSTDAPPEVIWKIWTDISNWHQWDTGLQSAKLNGDLQLKAKGTLIPDKGPKAKFIITEFISQKSYTFRTGLPFGALHVKRVLVRQNDNTIFTHEVWFTGLAKLLFGKALGKRYRKLLPEVMNEIKQIAEKP